MPGPKTSLLCGNFVRETSVKRQKKKGKRNNAKCSICFQLVYNKSDRTWFFNALTLEPESI